MYSGSRIEQSVADGRGPAVIAAEREYYQLGGTLVQDGALVRLWDHRRNRHVYCRCTVVSIGKGPEVKPAPTPKTKRAKQAVATGATRAEIRLVNWIRKSGMVTAAQVATYIGCSSPSAKALLQAHPDLFEAAMRVAGTQYYRAR